MKCGKNPKQRLQFVNTLYTFAETVNKGKWKPKFSYDIEF